jgi:serine/threonine protein kinase
MTEAGVNNLSVNRLTAATNFYALGILLYQLSFKSLPSGQLDSRSIEILSFNSENHSLKPLILRLLKTDPDELIKTIGQFYEALETCHLPIPQATLPLKHDISQSTKTQSHADKETKRRLPLITSMKNSESWGLMRHRPDCCSMTSSMLMRFSGLEKTANSLAIDTLV